MDRVLVNNAEQNVSTLDVSPISHAIWAWIFDCIASQDIINSTKVRVNFLNAERKELITWAPGWIDGKRSSVPIFSYGSVGS
jgi:hypothetical protein